MRALLSKIVSAPWLFGLGVLVVQLAYIVSLKPLLEGDGAYYFLMQQAFLSHGSPVITPAEIEALRTGYGYVLTPPEGFFHEIGPDRWIAWHNPFYPLLTLPFRVLVDALRIGSLYSFPAFNLVCVVATICAVLRSSLDNSQKSFLIICFGVCTLLYVRWPHPEVFTVSLLLVGILAWLEERLVWFLVLVALASWQNPSAILASVLLLPHIERVFRDWRLLLAVLFFPVLALVPYFYAYAVAGTWSLIGTSGFVDFGEVSMAKWLSLVTDIDQGMIILLAPILPALVLALAGGGFRSRPLRIGLWLIAAFVLMSLPVLAQTNWNSGQHLVLRYVVWLIVPVFVASAILIPPRSVAPCLAALVGFACLLGWAGHDLIRNHIALGYFTLRPWTRLSTILYYYEPLPEIFVERALQREAPNGRPDDLLPVAIRAEDGSFTKILGHAGDAAALVQKFCSAPAPQIVRSRPAPNPAGGTSDLEYIVASPC